MAPFFLPVGILFQEGPQTVQVDEKLTVSARHVNYRKAEMTFDEGVVAKYGVTTVFGDHLEVSAIRSDHGITIRKAIARGNVRMVDPEGEVRADTIQFDWIEETGTASGAKISVADMEVSAATIDIQKDELKLYDVSIILCGGEESGMSLRELSVNKKGYGIGRGIRLSLAGKKVLGLPHYRFSFRDDGRQGGMTSPNVSLRGRSLGVSWDPEVSLAPLTLLDGSISAVQGMEVSGKLYITQSLLSAGESFRGPRSSSVEPYSYGFMESVSTKSVLREQEYVRRPRATISIGTAWNQGRYSDQAGRISKPFEAIFEGSGPVGDWGLYGQARFQRIDVPGISPVNRWEVLGSVSPPAYSVGKTIRLFGRGDVRSELQPGEDYGWVRGQLGVSILPNKRSAISLAYSRASQWGVSMFEFDRPVRNESVHLRGDFEFGPTKLSGLLKFEPGATRPFDTEVFVSQLAGCVEVFALWRESPRTFSVGFKLRSLEKIADAGDRIGRRTKGNNVAEPDRN